MGLTPGAAAAPKIGVFGGAFDPPHAAHVQLVLRAIAELGLDRVLVIPTGQAWHKARVLSAAAHRLAMTRLAFAAVPQVEVDPRETLRSGATYTYDTLEQIRQQNPTAELYLLIGEDQARRLSSWHRADELTRIAIICVAGRTDSTADIPGSAPWPAVETGLRRLQGMPDPISATEIRERVSRRQGIVPLVGAPVARYIDQHHLYQTA